jgi:hypothetical protein
MEERSIKGCRDGIDVEAVPRAGGNAVTLTYDPEAFHWIQLRDPGPGAVLFTAKNERRTLHLTTSSRAVEIKPP